MFWYPWGKEALERARKENKPILLSIGYSTCYWCHVMERDVFENLSIASQMNKFFINVKVDREEHPQLDDIYMTARQMMTDEGGWPNTLFLTPDLKPFHAGGTYAADDSYGRPAFPRVLEWINHAWTTQESSVRRSADELAKALVQYLQPVSLPQETRAPFAGQASSLFSTLEKYYDERSGGFFQAPKFPHETYLQFLLGYYEQTGQARALDMAAHSLGKMAAGGLNDQVGCGFHRYAVDKEWYVPHFEKMLYNQAMLARAYTDAARLTGNEFLADVARSILEFVSGPLTDGSGAFYSAIDAETDQIEGAYYAWTPEEITALLSEDEARFFTTYYALADIPQFPGHKHTQGKVIIARKPLAQAALEAGMPYAQLAAMSGQLMNKLLVARNQRKAPHLDDKIIVAWNGLMIDALAHAGKTLGKVRYVVLARKAADYILEHAIDNEGNLKRLASGRSDIPATLEDYAFLVKGLISLWRATPDEMMLDAAKSLMARAEELFWDAGSAGYFFSQPDERLWLRIKSGDDSALPGANGVMLENLVALYDITQEAAYLERAKLLAGYFLKGVSRAPVEHATLIRASLRLSEIMGETPARVPAPESGEIHVPDDALTLSAALFPADAKPGEHCELLVSLDMKEGWHINANDVSQRFLVPTQLDVQGNGVELLEIIGPEPLRKIQEEGGDSLRVYEGLVTLTARLKLAAKGKKRPPIKLLLRYQPCNGHLCARPRDASITI